MCRGEGPALWRRRRGWRDWEGEEGPGNTRKGKPEREPRRGEGDEVQVQKHLCLACSRGALWVSRFLNTHLQWLNLADSRFCFYTSFFSLFISGVLLRERPCVREGSRGQAAPSALPAGLTARSARKAQTSRSQLALRLPPRKNHECQGSRILCLLSK